MRARALAVGAAILVVPLSVLPQEILVRQKIDTNYSAQLNQLDNVFQGALSRGYRVNEGDTLSRIVYEQFDVSYAQAPEVFEQFTRQIAEINGIEDVNAVIAGDRLEIPDLPRHASFAPRNLEIVDPSTGISVMQRRVEPEMAREPNYQLQSDDRVIDVFQKFATNPQSVIQIRSVDRGNAIRLQNKLPDNYSIANFPLKLTFAHEYPRDATFNLKPEDQRFLWDWFMANSKEKSTYLVVLDDAWPTVEEYEKSLEFFRDAIPRVRDKYRMGQANLSDEFLTLSSSDYEEAGSHALSIMLALQPFGNVPGGREAVDIIYVPLFAAQVGAKELLRQLIEIREIRVLTGASLGDPVDPADLLIARMNAANTATNIANQISTDVSNTDYAVIDAVYEFFALFSNMEQQPFFLNMSWTAPHMNWDPSFLPEAYGLMIAAAGNETASAYDLRRQFVNRSRLPGDVLGVMDIDDEGNPGCCNSLCSSLLEPDQNYLILAFTGLQHNGNCGTSFAAPRISWLLAARESRRPAPSTLQADWMVTWRLETSNDIKNFRDFTRDGFDRIRLDVTSVAE